MRVIFALFLLFALLPTIGRTAPISISAEVQIEPVTSFTTLELWNATSPTSSDFGVVVVDHRMIDSEVPIHRGLWGECGLVMIGTGDIATRPVAFRVWTKQACNLSVQKSKDSGLSENIQFELLVNSKASLSIQVSRELVVMVSGIRIGRIRTGGEYR